MAGKGKKPVTIEQVVGFKDSLRKRLGATDKIVKAMQKRKLKSIEAMGLPMTESGLAALDTFIRDANKVLGIF